MNLKTLYNTKEDLCDKHMIFKKTLFIGAKMVYYVQMPLGHAGVLMNRVTDETRRTGV